MRNAVAGLVGFVLALSVFAAGQEGHPLTGTWSGDWGPSAAQRTHITMVMTWDGKSVSGTINPGPDAIPVDTIGLDVAKWETCFDARKYQPRINANLADGLRRGVGSTPTFVIGNKLYAGMRSYDELKRIVDSIARVSPAPAAATASTTKK